MKNQLLLLHGISTGGNKMRYYHGYNPVTLTRTKRRYRRPMMGASPEMKASFDAVKNIALLSGVAAISAIAIDFLFNSIKNKTDPTKNFLGLPIGEEADLLSRAGVGIVISIIYKKFIEKGRTSKIDIATGLALGPTVVSAYGIFSKMLKGPTVLSPRVAGFGYIEPIRETGFRPALAGRSISAIGGRPISAIGAQQVNREVGFRPQLEPLPAVNWGAY